MINKKYVLTSVLAILALTQNSFAQETKWSNVPTVPHTWMVGAGPTFFGANLKGGIFLNKHFLVGGSVEVHELLSSRKEAGIFGRKYINSNRLSVFVQAGPSYGSFKEWDLNLDTPERAPLYTELKLNGGVGAEFRLNPSISFEGELGIGRILNTDNWWAPSIRSSINFRFYKLSKEYK